MHAHVQQCWRVVLFINKAMCSLDHMDQDYFGAFNTPGALLDKNMGHRYWHPHSKSQKMAERDRVWSSVEIKSLIGIWGEANIQAQLTSVKKEYFSL